MSESLGVESTPVRRAADAHDQGLGNHAFGVMQDRLFLQGAFFNAHFVSLDAHCFFFLGSGFTGTPCTWHVQRRLRVVVDVVVCGGGSRLAMLTGLHVRAVGRYALLDLGKNDGNHRVYV